MKTLLIEVPDDVYERDVYYWAAARYFPAKAKEAVEVKDPHQYSSGMGTGVREYSGNPVTLYAVKRTI